PWLAWLPDWLQTTINLPAPLVTAGFIAADLVLAVRLVGSTGHTLSALPLTLTQWALFTLLFFQIACHVGADQYSWDRAPSWWEWLWFSGAHALRAGDLLDVIEAYDLNIQPIRHAGQLTAFCLVLFHLFMALFLISLLLEGFRKARDFVKGKTEQTWRQTRAADNLRWWLRVGPRLALLGFILAWVETLSARRGMPPEQIALWFAANTLKLIDFADVLEIYRVRLHNVSQDAWMATLT